MKQAAAAKTTPTTSGDLQLGAGSVALTFLDTTWRIATPVVLFTFIGIYADLHLGTKPWLTLLCVVIGFAGAVLLVKRQLEAVANVEKAEKKK
ncbi:MAG TPA: AtpZ/AtpI family protein [Patescibacteria group bacterium]|nr:AtpZ/AtpI family protein [Patescibacteria group bacterium]